MWLSPLFTFLSPFPSNTSWPLCKIMTARSVKPVIIKLTLDDSPAMVRRTTFTLHTYQKTQKKQVTLLSVRHQINLKVVNLIYKNCPFPMLKMYLLQFSRALIGKTEWSYQRMYNEFAKHPNEIFRQTYRREAQMDECWPSFQFILLAFPRPEIDLTFIIPSHLDQRQFQGFRSWGRRKERAEKNSEGWGRGWVASKRRIISLYENWSCLSRTWWIATSPTGYKGVICDLDCWF